MTAPVPAAEGTHDVVTAAMLRHRRLLTTLVLIGVALVCLAVVVALLRARTQPWLGLQMARSGVSLFSPSRSGGDVAVRFVRDGGPAYLAGLRAGDRVLHIDGIPANDIDALTARHDRLRPGDVIAYEIGRDGQRLRRLVTTGTSIPGHRGWPGIGLRVAVAFALFLGIPSLVYQWRRHDPRALLFLLFSTTFGLSMLNAAVPGSTQPPDTVIPMPDAYVRMNFVGLAVTFAAAFVVSPTLLHFLLLFPQPRLHPGVLARVLRWTYLVPALIAWFACPVFVLLAARRLPPDARTPAVFAVAAMAAGAALRVWWTRVRGRSWRENLLDAPLPFIIASALADAALILTAIAIVGTVSRPMAGLIGGLLLVATTLLFSMCLGLAYPIASGVAVWQSWRQSSEEERRQIRWPLISIAWALGIAVLLSLVSIGLSFTSASTPPPWLYPVFEASTWVAYSVIPLAFAAAVLRYGLMDIRFIIRLTFFYLLTSASVYVGAAAVVLLVGTMVAEATESTHVTTVLITLLAVTLLEPLRRRVQRRVDKHFYQRTPDPVGVLARHGEALRSLDRRDDLERGLVLALQEAIPHGPTYVFRRREERGDFIAAHSPDPTARDAFEALPFLTPRAPALHGPTILAEVTMLTDEAHTWDELGVELLLPVRQADAIPIVLGLGRKRSDDAWQERDLELLSSLASQTSMALADIEARQHDASLREAFDNQRALLPQQLPQPEAFSVAGAWHPALAVGGDYYDAWWLSSDAVALCIADVAGKGLAASLLMANLQATVKALAGPDVSPAEVCTRVNETLASNLRRSRFVTFFYGVLRLSTSELRYANAGHNPPLLVSGNQSRELGLGDPGLGLLRTHRYSERTARLDGDARLLLFTDGVTEGRSPDGEDFGVTRLLEIVSRPHTTAGALRDDVLSAIAAWTQGQFDDDVTLLAVIRRTASPDELFQSQRIRIPV